MHDQRPGTVEMFKPIGSRQQGQAEVQLQGFYGTRLQTGKWHVINWGKFLTGVRHLLQTFNTFNRFCR